MSQELDARRRKLIEGLRGATQSGRLAWSRTANKSAFQASLAGNVIQVVDAGPDQSGQDDYRVIVLDRTGAEIDSIWSFEEQGLSLTGGVLRALYIECRASALGIDKAYDGMLSELFRK